MIRNIDFSNDGRKKVKKGIDAAADAIKVTFGGAGRNVFIERVGYYPVSTKDGVTVANAIELKDSVENMGAMLIREIAKKTVDISGDGTTCASVLAQKIISLGMDAIEHGANPIAIKKGIEKAVVSVVKKIKEFSVAADSDEILKQVATISANNDVEIGELIAKAIGQVGRDGIVEIEESKGNDTLVDMVEGMQFDSGYISPYFINNEKKGKCELENPFVLLFENKMTANKEVANILVEVVKTGRSILIICEDLSEEVLRALVGNKVQNGFNVCAVKIPRYGGSKKLVMEDIAVLTNGTFISKEKNLELKNAKLTSLGSCDKVVITKDKTTIIGGAGGKALVEERCVQIQTQMVDTETNDFEITKLKERLAKLQKGIAVIKIGGATEIEVAEKRDRIDDSLCATRAAVDEGFIAGGGVTFLQCTKVLSDIKCDNKDEQIGVDIIKKAIEEPFRQILTNAFIDIDIEKVLSEEYGYGVNVKTGEYLDLFKHGIIDPAKVARVALENAASGAAVFLITECVISNNQN